MKKISLILVFVTVILCFTSCYSPLKFKFMHDTSEIVKVEVVEFSCKMDWIDEEWQRYAADQTTLATVADIEEFVSRLSEISHGYIVGNHHFTQMSTKCIAFKLSYANGDYEVFDNSDHVNYHHDTDTVVFEGAGCFFDSLEFNSLAMYYLADSKASYTLMYDPSEISRIDFVRVINAGDEETYEVIDMISDIPRFIQDQQNMKYIYDIDLVRSEEDTYDGVELFRITYKNGSYELFNQSVRKEVYVREGVVKKFQQRVNIGRFAPEDYAAFEAKYSNLRTAHSR